MSTMVGHGRWLMALAALLLVGVPVLVWLVQPDARTAAGPAAHGGSATSSTAPAAAGPATSAPTVSVSAGAQPTAVPTASVAPWAQGLSVAPAVALDATATTSSGLSASIASITRVEAVAHGPGEVAGPAVRIVVRLHNATAAPLDLDAVGVDVYAADGRPGRHYVYDASVTALRGSLAVGADASGAYLVGLADPSSNLVAITVTYAGDQPAVVFQGTVSA